MPVIEQFNYIFIEITSVETRENSHCTAYLHVRILSKKNNAKAFTKIKLIWKNKQFISGARV